MVHFRGKLSEALPYLIRRRIAKATPRGRVQMYVFTYIFSVEFVRARPDPAAPPLSFVLPYLGRCLRDTFEHISASVCRCP